MKTIDKLNNAILDASMDGKTKDVLGLISQGADVNTRDNHGYTPLHLASFHGQTETVLALISKGADIHANDNHGMTAIHFACKYGQTETALSLISKGADVNAKDNGGQTPLHCTPSSVQVALVLISKGADIHAKDENFRTPLLTASFKVSFTGSTENVLLLISYGADASKVKESLSYLRRLTMYQAAAQGGFTERTIELLNNHPSSLSHDAPDALAALAKQHGKYDTAAAIQAFIASQAIEAMVKEARNAHATNGQYGSKDI